MELFFSLPFLSGPFRLGLFLLFFILIHKLTQSRTIKIKSSSKYAKNFTFYASTIILLCFALIQINAFDRFIILFLLFGFILVKALNLRWNQNILHQLQQRKDSFLFFLVRNFDRYSSFSELVKSLYPKSEKIKYKTRVLLKNQNILLFVVLLFIITSAYLTRFYFFHFDTYSLTDAWYNDLLKMKGLHSQKWLISEGSMLGEYTLIALYGLITNISDAMALHSFGLIESVVLSVSIFWCTSKITHTKFIPGLLAALSFIFLYGLLPLNIGLITQHKSVFLALCISLPAIVFVLIPNSFTSYKKEYVIKLFIIFCAIGFVNFFVMVIVLTPLIFLALLLAPKNQRSFSLKAFLAYVFGLVVVVVIHGFAAVYSGESLQVFLNSNLYSVSSYTYTPQLIIPYPNLIFYLQIGAMALLILVFPLWFENKKKWYPIVVTTMSFTILVFMYNSKNMFFDRDLLNQVISVFIPIFFGLFVSVIFSWFKKIIGINIPKNYSYKIAMSITCIAFVFFYFQKGILNNIDKRSLVKENILQAYDALENTLLPYSYAVVNNASSEAISTNSHYFINYKYFNNQYLDRDNNFNKFKNNPSYLKTHPEVILPKSIFVFLYVKETTSDLKNEIILEEQILTQETLRILKKRNRQIKQFFKRQHLVVYEIVNVPKSSNINDLLF